MKHYEPTHSPAIGQRITALSYDVETGYLVIELDNSQQLWLSADNDGFHVFMLAPPITVRHTTS